MPQKPNRPKQTHEITVEYSKNDYTYEVELQYSVVEDDFMVNQVTILEGPPKEIGRDVDPEVFEADLSEYDRSQIHELIGQQSEKKVVNLGRVK